MSLPRIFQKVFREPALMMPDAHESIQHILLNYQKGFDARLDVDRTLVEKDTSYKLIDGKIGLLKVSGIISKRLSMLEGACGAYDQMNISSEAKKAIEDPNVEFLIIDFDTAGGSVTGTYETGRMLRELSQIKPIYAYTETLCASCGYWLASQCTSIIMAPSAVIGCIGVYLAIPKGKGENVDLIKAGKYKAIGLMPLTDDERSVLQETVDSTHQLFKNEVLAMRPDIPEEAMEGLAYRGNEAVELGLVDGLVMNFDELLEVLS